MNFTKSIAAVLGLTLGFSTILPTQAADTHRLKDHLGSLYGEFPWSGPLRDPSRDVEIHTMLGFSALTTETVSNLQQDMLTRDVIMQIGGMGSAKKNQTEPGKVNPQFAEYMNGIVADKGASWIQQVTQRTSELAAITPSPERLTWQIGNEINSLSYSENIHYYFKDGKVAKMSDQTTIATYVEYFLAPTIQGIQAAEAATGKDIRIALGSIASASMTSSQVFSDTLLNYKIVGTNAPALAGRSVYELIDIITVHYFMGAGSPTAPEKWREYLLSNRDKWVGKGSIKGIWSTEEVGIRSAEAGYGPGLAIRIVSRYMDWVSQNNYNDDQSKWFFYGTGSGSENSRIETAMQNLYDLVGDNGMELVSHEFLNSNNLEIYTYYVPAKSAYLITAGNIGTTALNVDSITTAVAESAMPNTTVSGWYYGNQGKETLLPTKFASAGKTAVGLNLPTAMSNTDAVVLWVSTAPSTTTTTTTTSATPLITVSSPKTTTTKKSTTTRSATTTKSATTKSATTKSTTTKSPTTTTRKTTR